MSTAVAKTMTMREYWRHAGLWRLLMWGLVVVCLYDGAGYAVKGNDASHSDSFIVLKAVPGGLHTHGAILLMLAIWLVAGLTAGGRTVRYALSCFVAYGVWTTVALLTAWKFNDQVVWSSPTKWFFLTYVGFLLAYFAPSARELTRPVRKRSGT